MSTRTRESAPPGKEKRGKSPSPTATGATQSRRSPVLSKSTSADSGRTIPSYLKPTASSINDARLPGKKPATTLTDSAKLARRRSFDKPPSPSSTQRSPVSPNPTLRSSSFSGKISTDSAAKPALARRRSFDKPPSPSRTQKSPASPSPALRSSSLPGKVGASQKGELERNSKGPKESGKQPSLYARAVSSVRKGSALAKKNEPVSGSSRKERVVASHGKAEKPDVPEPVSEPEPEVQCDDPESFMIEEQTVLVEDYIDKESVDSLLDDQEVPNIIERSEGESEEREAEVVAVEAPMILEQHAPSIVAVESPTVVQNQDDTDKAANVEDSVVLEHQDASHDVETKDLEEQSQAEEINSQQDEIKEHTTDEVNHADTDQSVAGDPDQEVAGNPNQEVEVNRREGEQDEHEQDQGQEQKDKEDEDVEEKETTGVVNKEEEVDGGSEAHEPMEKEVDEVVEEEAKEAEDATPRVAHGKKDLALSNDVIEETKNKLIEQRKNKVKALAGAFESVISLQDPK